MAMGNKMVKGFIFGAAAGAAVGLMVAPKSGKETREILQHRAGEAFGTLRNKIGPNHASS